MDMNSLQQWMDFAHRNGLFDQYRNNTGFQAGSMSNFQPTVFNVPMMEANWARGMGGSGMGSMPGYASQNFFAGLPGAPSYVSPQPFNPGPRPTPSVTPQNFLSMMVKR